MWIILWKKVLHNLICKIIKNKEEDEDDEQIFTLTIDNDKGFNKLKINPINEKIQNKNYSIKE